MIAKAGQEKKEVGEGEFTFASEVRGIDFIIFNVQIEIPVLRTGLEKKAMPNESAPGNLICVVPTTEKGNQDEQIQKNGTYNMVLRIPFGVVSKIPISSIGRKDKRRSGSGGSQPNGAARL
jgi:hypothetical protein